jgi:hypothetical protein
MDPRIKTGLLAGVMALLGITAIAGWTRKTEPVGANAFVTPGYSQPAYGQPAAYAPNTPATFGNPAYSQNGQYAQNQYGQTAQNTYATASTSPYPQSYSTAQNCSEPAYAVRDAAYAPYATERVVYRDRPHVVRTRYIDRTSYVAPSRGSSYVYHRGRTKKKSALIVLGSAGTGAAIGALAGGGKGAAIGALSGGAAGFIYDRLTHNKVN